MSSRPAVITLLLVVVSGCSEEKSPGFALSITFRGHPCGGHDLLNRQRVSRIEYEIYGAGGFGEEKVREGSIPCSDEPIIVDLAPVSHRAVVRGFGDDGQLCWDTGSEGEPIAPWAADEGTVDVPAICVLDDAVRLTVDVVGPGDVIAEPDGIDCPSLACVATYDRFAGVRLTAKPRGDTVFAGWSRSCGGDSDIVTVAMISERRCVATFVDPNQVGWTTPEGVPGPVFGASWDLAIEQGGPLLVYESGEAAIGASRTALVPTGPDDWESGEILAAGEGDVLGPPNVATDGDRTFVTATVSGPLHCGIAVLARESTGAAFSLFAELELAEAPCEPERGRALTTVAGAPLLVTTPRTDEAIFAHLAGVDATESATLFQASSAGAVRDVSRIVSLDGKPAFAFSTFDRELEQGEIWVALAISERPASRGDWSVHPIFSAPRIPDAPDIAIDGARLSITFATIEGFGRESERRSQHLATAQHVEPRATGDWSVVTVDPDRGGPASILQYGSHLVIAYGHDDAATGQSRILVASTVESNPISPADWTIREIDRTVLLARPRLLEIADRLAILYSQGPAQPLVLRTTDTL